MSTMPSFEIGVAAMVAHSIAMDAISQNIANVRTPGYRRADTTFATLLSGIDNSPYKPGGVQAETRRLVDVEGAIEQTDRPLDLALNGKGFFVYSSKPTGAGDISYSRRGSLFGTAIDNAASVGSYLSAFEDKYLMAWAIDPSGNVVDGGLSDMVAIPASLNDPFPGRATTQASIGIEIPAVGTSTVSTDIAYFDSAGQQQSLRLTWTNTGVNAWVFQASDSAGSPLGSAQPMTFDGNGALTSATTVDAGGLFSLDVSNIFQRGSVFYRGLYTQDGLEKGEFVDYEVDSKGVVSGRFSSGATSPLYQLPVAIFANVNGLSESAENLWVQSANSGAAEYRPAGDLATVFAGSREASNVDLADAFTQLIVTQRAYSSAAQLVRTTDEMLETIRDLRR